MGLVTWARLGMYRLKEKRVRTTPSITALPLFLGYLWVLVDDERQTWHDRLAKTIVVYEWDARYEERLVGAVRHLSDSAERRQAAQEHARRLAAEGDDVTETGDG